MIVWVEFDEKGRAAQNIDGEDFCIIRVGERFRLEHNGVSVLDKKRDRERSFAELGKARAFCLGLANGEEPAYSDNKESWQPPARVPIAMSQLSRGGSVSTSTGASRGPEMGILNWQKPANHNYVTQGEKVKYEIKLDKKADRYVLEVDGVVQKEEGQDLSMFFYYFNHAQDAAGQLEAGEKITIDRFGPGKKPAGKPSTVNGEPFRPAGGGGNSNQRAPRSGGGQQSFHVATKDTPAEPVGPVAYTEEKAWKCQDEACGCISTSHGPAVYHCTPCDKDFNRDQSANNNHQCPTCETFGRKVAQQSCTTCKTGKVDPIVLRSCEVCKDNTDVPEDEKRGLEIPEWHQHVENVHADLLAGEGKLEKPAEAATGVDEGVNVIGSDSQE